MKRHNFRNLKIWKDGVDLTMQTYEMVRSFPDFEKFNLSSQLIRSAISIPSNIAEGTAKSPIGNLHNILNIVWVLLLNGKHN